jgi:hypothetical protein
MSVLCDNSLKSELLYFADDGFQSARERRDVKECGGGECLTKHCLPACERLVFQIFAVEMKEIKGLEVDIQFACLGVLQRIESRVNQLFPTAVICLDRFFIYLDGLITI